MYRLVIDVQNPKIKNFLQFAFWIIIILATEVTQQIIHEKYSHNNMKNEKYGC